MTNQELTDLAHANLKVFREELELRPNDQEYGTTDMLTFHKQGIREGLAIVLKELFDPEDPTMLEEDQFGYHLLAIKQKYSHLLPE